MARLIKLIYKGEIIRNYSLPQYSDKRKIIDKWLKLYPIHKFRDCKIITEEDANDYISPQKLNKAKF